MNKVVSVGMSQPVCGDKLVRDSKLKGEVYCSTQSLAISSEHTLANFTHNKM